MGLLPTKPTPKKTIFYDHTALVYGPSKIGKSTWCSQAQDVLFLETEPGLNQLEVYQTPIINWDQLRQVTDELAQKRHPFKTVVLDTVDNAFRFCQDWVCEHQGVTHESDLGYGKGYSLINREFQLLLTRLAQLPSGLILVSHSQEKELETKGGKKYTKTTVTLPDKAAKIVLSLVDMILFFDVDADGKRVIYTKPSATYEAGDRTGRLPPTIAMDFPSFLQAFTEGVAGAGAPPAGAAPSGPEPQVLDRKGFNKSVDALLVQLDQEAHRLGREATEVRGAELPKLGVRSKLKTRDDGAKYYNAVKAILERYKAMPSPSVDEVLKGEEGETSEPREMTQPEFLQQADTLLTEIRTNLQRLKRPPEPYIEQHITPLGTPEDLPPERWAEYLDQVDGALAYLMGLKQWDSTSLAKTQ